MHRLTRVWSVWVLALVAGCGDTALLDSSKSAAPAASAIPAVEGRAAEDASPAAESAAHADHARPRSFPKSHIQSGTLTAGSIDDHEKYDEFRELVATAQQTGLLPMKSHFDGRRVPIVVRNSAGQPLSDVVVRVFASSQSGNESSGIQQLKYQPQSQSDSGSSRVLIELKTGSDGRAQFLPSLDGAGGQTEFSLEVTLPQQEPLRTQSVSMNHLPWVVTVDEAQSQLPQQLDLALLVDTTGSMGDELEYLKVEIDSIATRVKSLFPNVDQRFALILYRDKGDEYVTRTFNFTSSLTDFRRNLSQQSAGGGGDYPEAMQDGLEQATQLSWRDQGTARVMFLVGDAPPHAQDVDRALKAVQTLRRKDVAIYPIAGSGAQKQAEAVLRMTSFLTQGQYLFLTDHSGVGFKHDAPSTASYNVERLDQLMVRMIASELAGKTLLATDIIAIEQPGTSDSADPQSPASQESQPDNAPPTQAMNCGVSPTPASWWDSWNGSQFRACVTLSGVAVLALFERLFARCGRGVA